MNRQSLTPKDLKLLDAYLATGSLPDAAKIVGMDRTTAWRRANRPRFQWEYEQRLDDLRRRAAAALLARNEAAWAALDRALGSSDERVSYRAAIWVLDRTLPPSVQTGHSNPSLVDLEIEARERELIADLNVRAGETT